MLLNDDEIKKQGLIENYINDNFRAVSYDLSIGIIITIDGKKHSSYRLPPQGIVEIMSCEKVKLPKNITGYAMVKTSLCNEGILPLNIGIIDPGYKGFLSSTLLNFSKNDYPLISGDIFLRLTFHECHPSSQNYSSNSVPAHTYIKDKQKKVVKFSDTFLNLQLVIEKVTSSLINKSRSELLTISALVLVAYPVIVTLAVEHTNRKSDLLQDLMKEKQTALEAEVKELRGQINQLTEIQKNNEKQEESLRQVRK